MVVTALLVFFCVCLAGTLLALVVGDSRAPAVLSWFGSLAAGLLVVAGVLGLASDAAPGAELWNLPLFGVLRVSVDGLSSLLLVVTGIVALPVAIFSHGYLRRYRDRYRLGPFAAMFHLLLASIAAVLVAGDLLLFLVSWEAMSVLSYLLVNFEHRQPANTRAGLLMLAMGEVGTLCAAAALLVLAVLGGGIGFDALRAGALKLGPVAGWVVFLLSFAGFGVKAGLVPLNTWLPRAHPAAPANVSALLSGVILNLGLYGILRVNLDLSPSVTVGQGLVVVIVGSVSAIVGILYATTENDMKKMLAHSSIENVGIITAGLGASLVFAACQEPALSGLALVASIYHLANHSVYKSLLFLGAGTIDARAGVRDMNKLGGLMRIMPWTGLFFLVGALAIAALPPLNGFVSEWLTLQAFLRSAALSSTPVRVTFVLCGAALALTAALAVTCFVKAFAMSFLGRARSDHAEKCKPACGSMRFGMGALALVCVGLGLAPTYVIPQLDHAVNDRRGTQAVEALVPAFFEPGEASPPMATAFLAEFHDLGAQVGRGALPGRGLVVLHRGGEQNPVVFAMSTTYTLFVLLLLLAGTAGLVRLLTRGRKAARGHPWAGGLRRLQRDMTYTATGFSNPVRVVFNAFFRPQKNETRQEQVDGHFRSAVRKEWESVHLAERWVVAPVVRALDALARLAARVHSGRINSYAAYLLLALIAVLLVQGLA